MGVQSLEPERLEGVKKKLISAWEAFDTAYDGLVAILIKDETLAAEMEEKDEEQRYLDATVAGLDEDLEGTIAQRRRGQVTQRLQQERQAENERLQ